MDFRQRLEQSRMHPVGGVNTPDTDTPVSTPFYAVERGSNPTCLDLRLANGSRTAVPYSYFTSISFDPDRGIEILTSQKHITITGRQLIALYEQLVNYKVRYVQADMGHDVQEDGLFVEGILIEQA